MTQSHGNPRNRRELLRGLGRYLALGALGGVTGYLLAKLHRPQHREKCIQGGICRGCTVFDQCHLPAALSAKQVLNKT